MKTWNETREVLEAARECRERGEACAIVVLTQVKGSAFRRPGAKLLIRSDGSMTGNVSGGCLENDLRERALACMATGESALVHYNTGSDEGVIWGLGLGCDGELDLLVMPVDRNATWLDDVLKHMATFSRLSLAWPLAAHPEGSPYLQAEGGANPPGEPHDDPGIFLDHLEPPPDLVIVGAGDDAIPLASQAADAGFRVSVTDHRAGYLTPERFPRSVVVQLRPEAAEGKIPSHSRVMVVIKNHALETDKKWAAFFDRTDVRYIGILGPKKRCADIKARMTSGRSDRVYGPAGLDIGAEGAEQIAVSIVAQLLSVWSSREPIHLHLRKGPIHSR